MRRVQGCIPHYAQPDSAALQPWEMGRRREESKLRFYRSRPTTGPNVQGTSARITGSNGQSFDGPSGVRGGELCPPALPGFPEQGGQLMAPVQIGTLLTVSWLSTLEETPPLCTSRATRWV